MADKFWLEVSLTVDGELAEAVADVLRRYLPDGVVIESTAVVAGPADENGQAVGPLRVCGYIPVDSNLEETQQKIEQGLWYLGRISPMPDPMRPAFPSVSIWGWHLARVLTQPRSYAWHGRMTFLLSLRM
jgi:hypothetical protein